MYICIFGLCFRKLSPIKMKNGSAWNDNDITKLLHTQHVSMLCAEWIAIIAKSIIMRNITYPFNPFYESLKYKQMYCFFYRFTSISIEYNKWCFKRQHVYIYNYNSQNDVYERAKDFHLTLDGTCNVKWYVHRINRRRRIRSERKIVSLVYSFTSLWLTIKLWRVKVEDTHKINMPQSRF